MAGRGARNEASERVPLVNDDDDGDVGQPCRECPPEDQESIASTVSEVVESVGMGRFQVALFCAMGLSWMAESAKFGAVALVAPMVACEWNLPAVQESMLTSFAFIGAAIGCYAFGMVADVLGRKSTYWCVSLLGVIGSLGAAGSPTTEWLGFCFFLLGLVVGGINVGPVYLIEYMPIAQRGRWGAFLAMPWALGMVGGAGIAWFAVPWAGWRAYLAMLNIPYVGVFALLPFFPESAHFLVVAGKPLKAMAALKRMAKINRVKLGSTVVLLAEEGGESTDDASLCLLVKQGLGGLARLLSRTLWWTTLTSVSMAVAEIFTYNSLLLLNTQIHAEAVGTCESRHFRLSEQAYVDMMIVSSADVIGNLLGIAMIEWIGRKWSLTTQFIGSAVALVPLLIAPHIEPTVFLFMSRAVVLASYSILVVYIPELYSTGVRTQALGLAVLMGSVASLLTPFVAQGLLQQHGLRSALGVICTVLVAGGVSALCSPRETIGEALQDATESRRKLSWSPIQD
ncbi:unnamed protein product [Ostreobium quekettii]|uniref:Major facilitator superfamily (MFS) profile domain-containing protein n=1 Tax=Ostreobium quekettii TaxID=121088 RepID=A0A8S1IWH9_9CHLO|nr:unnamed protein product [Ostreobium quekettii]|eukprot:evm.model.scf_550.7 EVM.evm.TU.scf_550.7   scf_550:66509-71420(-)